MCEKSFKKVDQVDCKNIALEVKKRAFLTPCKTSLANFESSWLKFFCTTQSWGVWYCIKKLDWKSIKKLKAKRSLFSFFNGSSNRKKYVIRGKNKLLLMLTLN
jgi:hypothetical protein